MRKARFKIKTTDGQRFDKRDEATLVVMQESPETGVIEVRPLRSRTAYTVTLQEVARMVISRAAKANVQP